MPNGQTHTKMTLAATIAVGAGAFFVGIPPLQAVAASIGCLTGAILSPDADVDGGFLGHNHVRRVFGSVIGKVWEVAWFPYAKLVPHRHPISHAPVISTIIRLAYVGLWMLLFGWLAWLAFRFDFDWAVVVGVLGSPLFYAFFIGLTVSDTLHFLADQISTRLGWGRD